MESCKSTWSSQIPEHKRRVEEGGGPAASALEGYKEWFSSLLLSLLAGVGAIVGDKAFYKMCTHSGRSVWVPVAFLAFIGKWMIYYEDLGMRNFTSSPSHPTGLSRASI